MKENLVVLFLFSIISWSSFAEIKIIENQLMSTDNWYTANTIDEIGIIEIEIPDNWEIASSVIYNEKNEKIAEGSGYFLYKINIGQRYNGIIENNLGNVDFEPSKIIERKVGNTKKGYLYDLEIIETYAVGGEGSIIWYPCKFFIYNMDYCFRITFYARNRDYQKELNSFIQIIDTIKFPLITEGIMNDSNVRIRSEPNLISSILGKLNIYDKVSIIGTTKSSMKIGELDNKWYKIILDNNSIGWIYGAYVDIEK